MKKITLLATVVLPVILFSCAPVLNRQLMKEGERNVSLGELRRNPEPNVGKLFVLGGIIVETRLTQNGSQIELLSVPVDSSGYLKESERTMGRCIIIYPRERGLLDPVVYKKGRTVTFAGTFLGNRKGKLDEMEYTYPAFEVRQIYLWEVQPDYRMYPYPYYPYNYYPGPYWYNPWWGPWPPPPGWW